ncbi:MAG: nitroreductase family protein [Planctomycetota bacterium]|jgi:hypothetical protein
MGPSETESRELVSHRELVRAAILAPSPDNNQPWRFAAARDRLHVHLDPQRALPSDVNEMFDLVGVGAAVENVFIAARQMGWTPHVQFASSAGDSPEKEPPAIATISFSPGAAADPLHDYLPDRCTCRKPFSRRPVADESLANILRQGQDFPEVRLDWVTDRARIRAFARVVAASDRFRFQYQSFHEEIYRQLRFTAEEAEQTRDGLDLRTLELPPGTGRLLRFLRPWNRMRRIHHLKLTGLLTIPSIWSVWKSGALGVLSLEKPTANGFLQGGRAFQRIWLAACKEGLSLHPLGSLPIFLGHLEQLDGRRLTIAHKKLARRLGRKLHELVPATEGRTLLMLFRLGHAAAPSVRSLRRPVDDVLC